MIKSFAYLLVSTSLACSTPALAQVAQDQAEDTAGLDAIVVTANRVESSAQDTPIALNVYSGSDLADQGVNSVRDLALIDPSVNVSTNTGSAYIAVRGVASTDVTELGDPSVPIARDGFFTNRAFSINTSMYDVARIEVLKGPQGTLQGRNSTGGVVSIITNRPQFENSGFASFDFGNYSTINSEIGANLAVSDIFAMRASGTMLTHKGYRQLSGPTPRGDDEDFASGRIQARVRTGGFEAWASYQHDSRSVAGDAVLKATLFGPKPDFDNLGVFPGFSPTSTKLTGDRFRWELAYNDLAGLNFIYAGGYDKQVWSNVLDATGPGYPANRQFRITTDPRTWNHEFRVSNDRDSKVFFQAGFFAFRETNTVDAGVYNREMTGPFAPGGPLAALAQPFKYGIKFDYAIKTKSDAVFAQVETKLSDTLELSLGGRYTWDEKARTGKAVLFLPALASPFAPPIGPTTIGDGQMKESRPTWHAGLNWRPTSDNMVYVKYDRGYKSGGFNSNGSIAATPYDAETVDAFEIGTKNSLMGNTLQLNASAFYFDYKGYQAQQSTCPTCSTGVFNVGAARVLGVEGQIVALLAENTKVNINATWLDTKFADNIIVRNGNDQDVDISGNQLPNAPHFTASVGIEQAIPVGNDKLKIRLDGKYSSSYFFSAFNIPAISTDAYFLGNASIAYEPDNGAWKVQLYVRNVFNKNVIAFAEQNFVADIHGYQFQPPRTFGVRLSANF